MQRRVTSVLSEIELQNTNPKRRVAAVWAETEIQNTNPKRRVMSVLVEIEVGIVLPYDFVSANIC